eukprot:Hpha_TRINITY_DN14473_c0_g1::TRINITY_DN14473_c0_g1_i2::g.157251::m.157251
MSGLVIFARPDPSCSGPAAREGPIPVELDSGAVVHDVIAELKKAGAVQGEVNVEWQGRRLSPSDALADVGLCPQSTVLVGDFSRENRRISAGERVAAVARPDGGVLVWGSYKQEYPPLTSQASFYIPARIGTCVHVSAGERTAVVLENGNLEGWTDSSEVWCEQFWKDLRAVQVEQCDFNSRTVVLLETGQVVMKGKGEMSVLGCAKRISACGVLFSLLGKDGDISCFIFDCCGHGAPVRQAVPLFDSPVFQVATGKTIPPDPSCGCIVVLEDNRVFSWDYHSSTVNAVEAPTLPGQVVDVCRTYTKFIALLKCGRVMAWVTGGDVEPVVLPCAAMQISASHDAFLALLVDGRVAAWGDPFSNTLCVPEDIAAEVGHSRPAHQAALRGDLEALSSLSDDLLDEADMHGQTPLMFAALRSHTLLVEFLLLKGADASAKSNWICTNVLGYAMQGGSREVVRLLVEMGNADLNDVCVVFDFVNGGLTPLQVAIYRKNEELIEYFTQNPRTDLESVLSELWYLPVTQSLAPPLDLLFVRPALTELRRRGEQMSQHVSKLLVTACGCGSE